MDVIKPPVTLEDWEQTLKSIHEMMANPYCDIFMWNSLKEKEERALRNIELLKKKRK